MVSSGYITRRQARAANRSPLQVVPNSVYQQVSYPYVFDYVKQQLVRDLGEATVERGGLKVYTTIDLTKQAEARHAILANESDPGDPAAALVSIDPTNGHILAMANSSTYGTGPGETTFDYATNAERQTGSAFKTFALMTLIHDQDGDPNQTYYNSHFLAPGWLPGYPTYQVHTAEETYQGNISVTRATTISDNTVYAQLGVDLGMSNVDATAHAMGITTKLCGNPSEVIGGLCVGLSPLQMADAYGTLANEGSHVATTIIAKVVLPDGKTINLGNPTPHRVFSPGEAYAGTQVLSTVVTSGTGTAANYGCPAAGKTGTTSNYTDAWFVGYTPELSTAVWVGLPQRDHFDDRHQRARARIRGHPGGTDLASVHGGGVGRLLQLLPHTRRILVWQALLRAALEQRLVVGRADHVLHLAVHLAGHHARDHHARDHDDSRHHASRQSLAGHTAAWSPHSTDTTGSGTPPAASGGAGLGGGH